MNKRNYISIDEVHPLIPLSRRIPFYYTEYSKIKRKDNDHRCSWFFSNFNSELMEILFKPPFLHRGKWAIYKYL